MAATSADICYGDTSGNFVDQDTYEEVDTVEDQQATPYTNLKITQPSENLERTKICKTEEKPVKSVDVTLRKDPEGQTLSLREKRIIFAVLGVFAVLLLATSVTSGVILSNALSRTENFEESSVDGQWTDWLEWSPCSVTCGAGQKRRQRLCLNLHGSRSQNGGINCSGLSVHETTCRATSCPLDGQWTDWLEWSVCSVTCGAGQKRRQRLCLNLHGSRSQNGGINCSGFNVQNATCLATSCPVMLTNGSSSYSGRVEIYYNSQWGTVCDDGWDDKDAQVVCRMMGRSGGRARSNAYYGQGNGPILLDGVNCTGYEESLFHCQHNGVGRHNCYHSEDAGLDCS